MADIAQSVLEQTLTNEHQVLRTNINVLLFLNLPAKVSQGGKSLDHRWRRRRRRHTGSVELLSRDQTRKVSLIRTVKLYNVNRSFIYGYSLQIGCCVSHSLALYS